MTLTLEDIDPGFDAGPGIDPAGLNAEDVSRRIRAIRFKTDELTRVEKRFDAEIERVKAAKEAATKALNRDLLELEVQVTGWFRLYRERQIEAGTDPDRAQKSMAFSDGTIRSTAGRMHTVMSVDDVDKSCPWVAVSTTVKPNHKAISEAVRSERLLANEDGVLLDTETGEIVPGIEVEWCDRSYRVTPEPVE